jgi:hypothetical protein
MLSPDDITFFKATIQDYLKLESEIKVLENAVKARKDRKKNLAETLLTFLLVEIEFGYLLRTHFSSS